MDSDPITTSNCPDDFTSIINDLVGGIQFKLFGLMFIVFILLSTDIFVGRVLSKFDGAVDHSIPGCSMPTSWGVFLQGLFLGLACIIMDAAIRQKII